ncbi:RES family NAD+ phosphorylase [Pseudooceanicola sp. CBS1P-1]|uniref:RES domain-containing protein n=1 Tax=Pseudooceanicola albus TaxID=2692189 RepID=A0A6L7G5H7_9RHOB|nr:MULTISPECIES: RES family NAD+ phosphorylase [Pseudooceanicola]MBT9385364.1 RES family NAD+ phosphorylase [Pseudooceanicola endophyticus]MXN18777.1 RES domain-containing protein [Pseudooceanicola albus]
MIFSLTLPPVTAFRPGAEAHVELPEGRVLHRIHPAAYAAAAFNPTGLGQARFSPLRDGQGDVIATIYAAESFECALAETILRSPDHPEVPGSLRVESPARWRDYCHSTVRLTRALRLLDLSTQGQRRIGVEHAALTAGPTRSYPETRAWAEMLHRSFPGIDGLHYHSHQYGPDAAMLLFGDRAGDALVAAGLSRAVGDPDCHRAIYALGQSLGITYIDL